MYTFKYFLENVLERKYNKLFEGGAVGHILNIWENNQLKFIEIIELLKSFTTKEFWEQNNIVEKIDGIQLSLSIKDSKLCFARNKSHLKNFGENSITIDNANQKAKEGKLNENFITHIEILNKLLKPYFDKLKNIFQEGKFWLSLEILDKKFKNIIDYDKEGYVFHHIYEISKEGVILNNNNDFINELKNIIKENEIFFENKLDINLESKILDYVNISIKNIISEINKYGLNDSNTISEYLYKSLLQYIKLNYDIEPNKELQNIILDRYIIEDKSKSLTELKKIFNEEIIKLFKDLDKNINKIKYELIFPISKEIMSFGAKIIDSVQNFINKDKSPISLEIKLKKELEKIKEFSLEDSQKIENLINKINSLGIKNIPKSEGLVFFYKDKMYKITGHFAILNKLLNLIK